jgi:hypothetical protein
MRGLASILFNRQPEAGALRTGLLMLTCSDRYADAIAARVYRLFPQVRWTILKRNEPGIAWFSGPTLFSASAGSLSGELSMFWWVRRRRYDIVVLSCTREPTFGLLKCMGILSAFKYLCIIDENVKESFAGWGNYAKTFRYLRRGFAGGWCSWRERLLLMLSWVLSPLGFLYVLARTGFLATRKVWNKNRATHT